MSSLDVVNSIPIYLGYEPSFKKYFFYVIKNGVPRFLEYASYFYWGKGPSSVLTLKEVPPEIETELVEYLKGNIAYEFYKQRRNSKEQSVRKIFRYPQAEVETEAVAGPSEGSKGGSLGRGASGRNSPEPASPEEGIKPDEPVRKRRPRKLRHGSDDALPSVSGVVSAKPKPTRTKDSEVTIETPVVSEKTPVGLSKLLKKLSQASKVQPKPLPVKVSEPKIEVPSEAPKKKRGRPRSVPTLEKPEEVAPTAKRGCKSNGISIRPEVNESTDKKTRKSRSKKPKEEN